MRRPAASGSEEIGVFVIGPQATTIASHSVAYHVRVKYDGERHMAVPMVSAARSAMA